MKRSGAVSGEASKKDSNTDLFRKLMDGLNLNADEIESIKNFMEQNSEELIDLFSQNLYLSLNAGKDELLAEHYGLLDGFRKRLFVTWEPPLKRLDSLIYICMEVVAELRKDPAYLPLSKNKKFNVATRLQARCVQIGNEISHLLHGGFADGAFARWRTLHETSATTKFICEGDEDLATRFLDYQSIIRFDGAKKYNDKDKLDFEPIPADQLEELKKEKAEILELYGAPFERKFGWARKALGDTSKDNLTFSMIEEFVELDLLRNHFSFANQYVHAGIDSIGFKLGTSMSNKDLLLTGPSNEGLLEPIQCTSLSLIYATEALIRAYPNDESLMTISILWMWHDALKNEVGNSSDALQTKGEAFSLQDIGATGTSDK